MALKIPYGPQHQAPRTHPNAAQRHSSPQCHASCPRALAKQLGSAAGWGRCTPCNSNKIHVNKCFLVQANEIQAVLVPGELPPPRRDPRVAPQRSRMGRGTSLAPRAVGHIPRDDGGTMPRRDPAAGPPPSREGTGTLELSPEQEPPPDPGPPQPRGPHLARECASPSTGRCGEQNALSAPVPSAYLQIKSIWGP